MDLSIIIVNFNVYNDVKLCIESIHKNVKKLDIEIIVVDNNSTDRSILEINNVFKDAKLIALNSNNGFGAANNTGMNYAKGKYLLLANPDIVFTDESIEIMYEFVEKNNDVGVVGPVQIKPNSGIEYYYTFFPGLYSRLMQEFGLYMKAPLMKTRFFDFWNRNIQKGIAFKVDWVMGSCMMLRSEIFRQTGGFDEAFFLFEEETEWQYRMNKLGWQTMMIPEASVLHNHHSSAGKLGKIFVNYHEFRSRIIFDRKRYNGFLFLVRVISIELAIFSRLMFNIFKSLFNAKSRIKIKANYDLLKFNHMTNDKIFKHRYNYDEKKELFR